MADLLVITNGDPGALPGRAPVEIRQRILWTQTFIAPPGKALSKTPVAVPSGEWSTRLEFAYPAGTKAHRLYVDAWAGGSPPVLDWIDVNDGPGVYSWPPRFPSYIAPRKYNYQSVIQDLRAISTGADPGAAIVVTLYSVRVVRSSGAQTHGMVETSGLDMVLPGAPARVRVSGASYGIAAEPVRRGYCLVSDPLGSLRLWRGGGLDGIFARATSNASTGGDVGLIVDPYPARPGGCLVP